jgi:bacteriorhodopsin
MSRTLSLVLGFVALFGIFYIMYNTFFSRGIGFGKKKMTFVIFLVYFILWALYGVIYNCEIYKKNLITNYLDLFAKAGFGLFFAGMIALQGRRSK